MKCIWHCCQKEAQKTGGGKFCGRKCQDKYYVDRRRKELKTKAIEYKGGKCKYCGYRTSEWALDFHHIDPSQKDFGISEKGHSRSWDRIKEELDKCVLVCKNCHAEIHHGLLTL